MTRGLRQAALLIVAALTSAAPGTPARAANEGATLTANARWEVRKGAKGPEVALVVPLSGALNQKQRNMIDGGFTTVSQLTLRLPIGQGDEDEVDNLPVFYSLRCSVKFDAWEETYDAVRYDDQPRQELVKVYDEYGEMCLKAELGGANLIARMGPSGGLIIADLVVKQTSQDEAAKIKDWLIQQQSGVMQSLFSHMLGELSLNQTVRVRVIVPAKPLGLEQSAIPQAPVPKVKG